MPLRNSMVFHFVVLCGCAWPSHGASLATLGLHKASKSMDGVAPGEGPSLAGVSAETKAQRADGWKDPDWFGGFSLDESTFNVAGITGDPANTNYNAQLYAADPPLIDQVARQQSLGADFFAETPSGGPRVATQTMSTASDAHWVQCPDGTWHQSYYSDVARQVESQPTDWFEYSVGKDDEFGRAMALPCPSSTATAESDHTSEGAEAHEAVASAREAATDTVNAAPAPAPVEPSPAVVAGLAQHSGAGAADQSSKPWV